MEERRNTNNNLNEKGFIHSFIHSKEGRRLAAVVVGLLERSLLTEMCKLFTTNEGANERNGEGVHLKIKTREIRCTVTKMVSVPKYVCWKSKQPRKSKIKNSQLKIELRELVWGLRRRVCAGPLDLPKTNRTP